MFTYALSMLGDVPRYVELGGLSVAGDDAMRLACSPQVSAERGDVQLAFCWSHDRDLQACRCRTAGPASPIVNGRQRQRIGIKIEHTEAALNHVSGTRGGIVGVYQTYNYEAELKDCYAQWEKRLQSILRFQPN